MFVAPAECSGTRDAGQLAETAPCDGAEAFSMVALFGTKARAGRTFRKRRECLTARTPAFWNSRGCAASEGRPPQSNRRPAFAKSMPVCDDVAD